MDKLDLLFQMQRELNIKIAKKNGIQDLWDLMEFDHGETSTRRKWLENFSDAMQSELVELTDSTKKWWWKQSDFDEQNARVELIDLLHFWISSCQALGMEPSDIVDLYIKKNDLNHIRQEKDYGKNKEVKNLVCQECHGVRFDEFGENCVLCGGVGYIEDNKLI